MSKIVMPGLSPTASASPSFGRLLNFGCLLNPDTQNHLILLHFSLSLSNLWQLYLQISNNTEHFGYLYYSIVHTIIMYLDNCNNLPTTITTSTLTAHQSVFKTAVILLKLDHIKVTPICPLVRDVLRAFTLFHP